MYIFYDHFKNLLYTNFYYVSIIKYCDCVSFHLKLQNGFEESRIMAFQRLYRSLMEKELFELHV